MYAGGFLTLIGRLRRVLLLYSFLFVIYLNNSCRLFSLRSPKIEEGEFVETPQSLVELLDLYKESLMASNINQYEMLLSDEFIFRVCDRIYYSNPEFYSGWDREMERTTIQNLFLALSRNENYPVFFENYRIQELDTIARDTQTARIEYSIFFMFSFGEVDTVSGYMDIIATKKSEYWQVDSIHDYSVNGVPCLSDVKIKFLSK